MISVQEVVTDPDMIAPQPFTILRSTGRFVAGGFQSTVTHIQQFGPVQQASNKEVEMLPEADRIGAVRAFWCTQPIYATRGQAPVPGVVSQRPTGSGTAWELTEAPPADSLCVYMNGLMLAAGADYTVDGAALTLSRDYNAAPFVTWQAEVLAATNASDQLQYGREVYRVLQVYRDPGGGYWKALATRMDAA